MGARFALKRAGKEALGRHGHFGRLYPVGTRILEVRIRSKVPVLLTKSIIYYAHAYKSAPFLQQSRT